MTSHKVSRVIKRQRRGGGHRGSVLRGADRAEGVMDMRILKIILSLSLGMGVGMLITIVITRWSEIKAEAQDMM